MRKKSFFVSMEGFAFVDVMISMAVFLVGMLGVVALQISGLKATRSAEAHTQASFLLQTVLEQFLGANYDSPLIRDMNTGNNNDLGSVRNVDYRNVDAAGRPVSGRFCTLVWNVADDLPVPGTKTIVASVIWDGGHRRLRCTSVKTRMDIP